MNLSTIIRHANEGNGIACQHLISTIKGQAQPFGGANEKKYFDLEGAFGSPDAFIIVETCNYQNCL
jgi:hypothetical protein